MESGIPECREKLMDSFLVRRGLQAAEGISKDLAHHALLAHGALGENPSQLAGVREGRVGNSSNLTLGVEVKVDLFLILELAGRTFDQYGLVLPQPSDRVEAFEAEADRIHQAVTR